MFVQYLAISLMHVILQRLPFYAQKRQVELFGWSQDYEEYLKSHFYDNFKFTSCSPKFGHILDKSDSKSTLLCFTYSTQDPLDDTIHAINALMTQHEILRLRITLLSKYIEPYTSRDYVHLNPTTEEKRQHIIRLNRALCTPLVCFFLHTNPDNLDITIEIAMNHVVGCARTFGMLLNQLKFKTVFKTDYDTYFNFKYTLDRAYPIIDVSPMDMLALPTKVTYKATVANIQHTFKIAACTETRFYHALMKTLFEMTGKTSGVMFKQTDVGLLPFKDVDISNCLGNNISLCAVRMQYLETFDNKQYKTMLNTPLGRIHMYYPTLKLGVNFIGVTVRKNNAMFKEIAVDFDEKITEDFLYDNNQIISLRVIRADTFNHVLAYYSSDYYSKDIIEMFIHKMKEHSAKL